MDDSDYLEDNFEEEGLEQLFLEATERAEYVASFREIFDSLSADDGNGDGDTEGRIDSDGGSENSGDSLESHLPIFSEPFFSDIFSDGDGDDESHSGSDINLDTSEDLFVSPAPTDSGEDSSDEGGDSEQHDSDQDADEPSVPHDQTPNTNSHLTSAALRTRQLPPLQLEGGRLFFAGSTSLERLRGNPRNRPGRAERQTLFGARYPYGTGLDHLVTMDIRPVGSRGTPVIDLTGEGDDHGQDHLPRLPRRSNPSNPPRRSNPTSGGSSNTPVIDLTLDDDSPPAHSQRGSRRERAPSNVRSNSRQTPVINLADDDEETQDDVFRTTLSTHPGALSFFSTLGQQLLRAGGGDQPLFLGFAARGGPSFAMDPLASNVPDLNYTGIGRNRSGYAPRLQFQAPPPARQGFTRDTCAEPTDDKMLVCPSCEEELKFDPGQTADNEPPAKRVRRRKNQEEHHFWALKNCGHVYCRRCFDNRGANSRASKSGEVNFLKSGKTVLCSVPQCNTEVGLKSAWVGLFV